jgi:hypothetical protein
MFVAMKFRGSAGIEREDKDIHGTASCKTDQPIHFAGRSNGSANFSISGFGEESLLLCDELGLG